MVRKQNKGIMELAENLQLLARKAVIEYKPVFNDIIDSNCQDKHQIERALDGMLDFCFDQKMLEMYRKLCRFYYDIDQGAAIRYVHYYREMWDPEEKKEWQKAKTNRAKK